MSEAQRVRICDLPMVSDRPRPCPKPLSRLEAKAAKDKADEQALERFRQAVWARDKSKCRRCRRKVIKTLALVPERGEVHHRRGRRVAPADRYNVDQAVLLCARCHGKAQRHEIEVK